MDQDQTDPEDFIKVGHMLWLQPVQVFTRACEVQYGEGRDLERAEGTE